MSIKFIDQRLAFCLAIITTKFFIFANGACDTATVPFTTLSMSFQHVQGKEKTTSYAHVLSTTQAFDGATCSAINPSLVLEAPFGDCTVDCLTTISPYMYQNATTVDIVMLKPDQVSLYPDYSAHDSKIFCATTSGYCGATVPLYNFVSSKYADHYTSADSKITDPDYALDNSGIPQCYGWSMPTQDADKYDQANYYSASDPTVCDVFIYFSISRTTTMSSTSTASTTNTASTSLTSSTTVSSTTMKTSTAVTTPTSTITTTSTPVTTKASTTTTTVPTTVKITTPNIATTTTKIITLPPATTPAPIPVTDSNGNLVTDASGNTITIPPVTAAFNPAIFVRSNFNSKPVRGRVNPYDRDLYTTDGMHDVPPVPVQTMPAQGATNVGTSAGAHYTGIGVAESSVI
uniref:Uncharacterized protein n=1 Tax=Panagrolaimus sp. ES5 TaxID=591445 RepID=A0AC34FWW0_9BILA